jgi:hypothetical protein
MISRFMTLAVLSAAMGALSVPAFAQLGPAGGPSTGISSMNTPASGTMPKAVAQTSTQRTVNQAQSGRRMGARSTDAMERQITECLNNSGGNRAAMDACRR